MKLFGIGLLVCGALLSAGQARAQVEKVDTSIGGVGYLLEPTRPTVSLPNSMLRVYPMRRDALDDQIHSFPLIVLSHRQGEAFWLMPAEGEPSADAWRRPAAFDQEKSTPYYYSTRLDGSLIQIEFTPTAHCGYFRFGFPSGKPLLLLANRQDGELAPGEKRTLSGTERFHDMKAYMYGEFSRPVSIDQSKDGGKSRLVVRTLEKANTLEFRYAISFISIEQARKSLAKEIPGWGFEAVKRQARDCWNQALGKVKVEGGTLAQQRVFYTALYRCSERMVNISEDGQYYSGYDHKVHQDPRPFYVDNWLWDTYRGLEPLQMLLNPDKEADKIQSYVRMYQQGGWMPSFALLWGDWPAMTGNHSAAWLADAWFKGITNFDLKTGYEGVRKNALEATMLPWRNGPKCPLDDFYAEHGYYPSLPPGEKETEPLVDTRWEKRQAVALTLDHSYDDWCTAQMARELGNQADYDFFLKRAANYKKVYRADKGFFWPKDAQGKWIEPFDPKFSGGPGARDYFTENNAYTYQWDAQQDYDGLFELMGGRHSAEAKLDRLFREDLGRPKFEFYSVFMDSSGMVGQFSMGNEPSMAIPYIYNHLGAPWKTQKRVRQLLESWFTDTQLGIPGDEDGGGLSAFVVFSMMGFYPVVPGIPAYELGSPVFDRVTIRLENGKTLRLVCKNNSHDNKYLRSIRFNGRPQNKIWFRHAEAVKGLTIELDMANTPNTSLGTAADELPRSNLSFDPRALAEFGPKGR
jgi:predicted alpha-1,2-mannosidase